MQRDAEFLLDIWQSAELILSYTSDCTKDEFLRNLQLQDAVIRRLLVMAEAAKRLSEETRLSLPNVSWKEMRGMRNRLVHQYDDLNLNIVWNVVQTEIPVLIQELQSFIPPGNS